MRETECRMTGHYNPLLLLVDLFLIKNKSGLEQIPWNTITDYDYPSKVLLLLPLKFMLGESLCVLSSLVFRLLILY